MDGLFHKITVWCIKYGVIKTTEKLLKSSKYNVKTMLCFEKLTNENDNKKNTLKFSFSGSIFLSTGIFKPI